MSSFGVSQVHGEKCASRHHSRERGADCISLNLRSLHWRLDSMGVKMQFLCILGSCFDGKHGKMTWHYFILFRKLGKLCSTQLVSKKQIAPVIECDRCPTNGLKDFDGFDDCWPVRWYFCYLGSGRCSGCGPTHVVFRQSGLGHPTLGGDTSHLHAVLVAISGAPWYPIIPSFRHLQHLQQHWKTYVKHVTFHISPPNH